MIKQLLTLVQILLFTGLSLAQNKTFELEFRYDTLLFSLTQNDLLYGNKVAMDFPDYSAMKPMQNYAFNSRFQKIHKKKVCYLELKVPNNVSFTSNCFIDFTSYTSNIDTINIEFQEYNSKIWQKLKPFIPNKDLTFQLKYSSVINRTKKDTLHINKIRIYSEVNKKSNSHLLIGRLDIRERKFKHHSLSKWRKFTHNYQAENDSYIYLELPDINKRFGDISFNISIQTPSSSEREKIKATAEIISKILEDYPYYSEKSIDKETIINKHKEIVKDATTLDQYYMNLKDLMLKLKDAHFRLQCSNRRVSLRQQSIRLKELSGVPRIIALFNDSLATKIDLDDELVAVNNRPYIKLKEEFCQKEFATSIHQREAKALSKFFLHCFNKFSSPLMLELYSEKKDTFQVELTIGSFKKLNYSPVDFKSHDRFEIKKFEDIYYLKIQFQKSILIPYFHSHLSQLQDSKGFILDLRGVGWGDNSFEYFLSFLITRMTSTVQASKFFMTSPLTKFRGYYTNLILPSNHNIGVKPIVILVDARTACAAELFISALKQSHPDVYIIGTTPTSGSTQFCTNLLLPSTQKLGVTKLFFPIGKTYNAMGKEIEISGGIQPTFRTSFNTYKELAPYQDKLVNQGINILRNAIKYEKQSK